MTEYLYIKYKADQGVAEITLNRPEVGNALHLYMIEELTDAFRHAAQNEKVRMVLLKGSGKHFCTGADLQWMADVQHPNIMQESMLMAKLFKTIHELPKPALAYVQGKCYGGGIGLAAACDFVWAEPIATFAFSEVKLGLLPATIAPYILKRTGYTRAKQLMITAREFITSEAMKNGLVDKIVEYTDFEQEYYLLLTDIRRGGSNAIASVKLLLGILEQPQYHHETEHTTASFLAQARLSDEGIEGMKAFLQKREPIWNNAKN
jgi:methylglutaconyl-CoA hydratase